MRVPRRWAVTAVMLALAQTLHAQNRAVEIGLDGGLEYSFDEDLLIISVPIQRVRAAFPFEPRLAFEPALSFTRLSTDGVSLTSLAMWFGLLYDLESEGSSTYARPFTGVEHLDPSFGDSESAFNLGAGVGTRSRIADQLALRIEASLTGRFGVGGGTDGVIGVTVGLSFFTR